MRSQTHKPCPGCDGMMKVTSARCQKCAGKDRSGASNPNWQGGRTITKAGYKLVTCSDHPRRTRDNYVLEHHLVMEAHLGRYLLPGENVHHKNLQRADNRLENLELWSTSQPIGARTEDLVDWAWEIILRYSVSDPSTTKVS